MRSFSTAALETAATTRAERALERRIRGAGFPSTTKTLDSYDFAAQPGLKKAAILQLATMEFVRQRGAAIFLGPTGTGKTHLSIGLGLKACQAGFTVRFTTAADLIATLTQAHRQHRLDAALISTPSRRCSSATSSGTSRLMRTGPPSSFNWSAGDMRRPA